MDVVERRFPRNKDELAAFLECDARGAVDECVPEPVATADSVAMEQGQIIMPACCHDRWPVVQRYWTDRVLNGNRRSVRRAEVCLHGEYFLCCGGNDDMQFHVVAVSESLDQRDCVYSPTGSGDGQNYSFLFMALLKADELTRPFSAHFLLYRFVICILASGMHDEADKSCRAFVFYLMGVALTKEGVKDSYFLLAGH